jgi:hypothetical protein
MNIGGAENCAVPMSHAAARECAAPATPETTPLTSTIYFDIR